ncbi:DUF1993 domain-containing protein [Luteimonas sp. BDR2-5]|uniref:DUF1993 domain-containing protein n=1 Tax=Proluteimonas luteida TaxID=2878685 RepID=UPI001E28F97D|nr:DUF1993 domain-containing protein [Luteimonas sp. BDR2-5]MCD9026724.1 DUF1993 domain-containing protein [Luteimonas sp. BDR2-5]
MSQPTSQGRAMTTAIADVQSVFASRLDTLRQLLDKATAHFGDDTSFLSNRLAPDMHPLGAQIAFTCNQPRNFALWCDGRPADNLDPEVASVDQACRYIDDTRQRVHAVAANDVKLDEIARIDLGPGLHADLPGSAYVHEFLIPNFYFHLVTTYAILRTGGLDIGKRDYMQHLVPWVRQA